METFRYLCAIHGVVGTLDRDDPRGLSTPTSCPVPDDGGRVLCGRGLTFEVTSDAAFVLIEE